MPAKENTWKRWLILSGIGIEMGAVIYIGHRIGLWSAQYWAIPSKLPELVGTLSGVALALFLVVRQTNKLNV